MNEFINNLLERPRSHKIAILGVVIILLGALFYSALYGPRSEEITKLQDGIDIAKNQKTMRQQRASNLPRLQKEIRDLDAKLKEAVAQLPNKKEMAELLSSISSKAQQAGLEVLVFRPRAENFQDFYAEVPVDITIKGNFHNAVGFFDEVGRLHRLINIDNIGFKNPTVTADQVILETTTVATAFRFLDEAERKKITEDKAKAAKEKK